MDSVRNRSGRFSLLLLDDGEVLISDIACHYRLIPECEELDEPLKTFASRLATTVRVGRVKVATRSIFFDSDDWRDPVVKIPISAIACVSFSRSSASSLRIQNNGFTSALVSHSLPTSPQWKSPRRLSADISHRRDMAQGRDVAQTSTSASWRTDSVVVGSKLVVFQRQDGVDHPYVEAQLEAQHLFTPLYTEGGMLEAELQSLKSINAIGSRRARESALRELVRERETHIPFDITLLQHGLAEHTEIDYVAAAIYALSRAPGRVRVTSKNLYFMPIHWDAHRSVERIPLHTIVSIRRLRHGCKNAALEIEYNTSGVPSSSSPSSSNPYTTLMLSFQTTEARENIFATLERFANKKLDIYGRNELDLALGKWRRGELSNYEYLMYLNFASGRSFNDLSQYPVFPWILSDYTSEELDLENPDVFRDLGRPIGALDETRLSALKERYEEMPPPRFFYGTHYSTPAYLINYLVRAAPGAMLRLQNGRFDMPDRLFHSIAETWKGVCTNPADVKELIPEFYTVNYSKSAASGIVSSTASAGQFLDNVLGLELGTRQDGKRVDAVELPPWAHGSSEKFVRKLRKALECRLVSEKLHLWIDLIFGVTSRSEAACNVFYTDVALPNSIDEKDMQSLTDDDINQMETIYLEFGRTPEQLFSHPHPPRFGTGPDQFSQEEGAPAIDTLPSLGIVTISSISEEVSPITQPTAATHISQMDVLSQPDHRTRGEETKGGQNRRERNTKSLPRSWEVISRKQSDNSILGRLQHVGRGRSSHRRRSQDDRSSKTASSGTLEACTLTQFKIAKIGSKACISDSILVNFPTRPEEPCLESMSPTNPRSPNSAGSPSSTGTNREPRNTGQKYALCTLSGNSYLRVQLGGELIRSRVLEGCTAICSMENGLIAYGTRNGGIGYYHINSGRVKMLVEEAHETRIEQLSYVSSLALLVSGSRDASVKVWQFQHVQRGPGALLLALELDAESSVVELATARDMAGAAGIAADEDLEWAVRQLLVAVLTADGAMLVWRPRSYSAGDAFPDPMWRAEAGAPSKPVPKRRMCWVTQGPRISQAVACISACSAFVRVWAPVQAHGSRAELVVACPRASCVSARGRSGTLLVGNMEGEMTEFDATGLCIGKRQLMQRPLHAMLLPCDQSGVFAVGGESEVAHVTF